MAFFIDDLANAVTLTSGSITIWDKGTKLFPKIRKILKDGKSNILIFGAGGVGKTKLGKYLSGEKIQNWNYEESLELEKPQLKNVFGNLWVAVGQERRIDSRNEINQKIINGKFDCIINVVAFGYHNIRLQQFLGENKMN